MFQTRAKVIKNIEVSKCYYTMVLYAPRIARLAKPGQFVQVRVDEGCEVLLRRPFSIHWVDGQGTGGRGQEKKSSLENVTLLYEIKGKGTEILAHKKTGETLDVIGPLGNGFDYRTAYGVRRTAIIVAGGMGVAPLLFLAEKIVHGQRSTVRRKQLVLIGGKTKSQILCEEEFKKFGCEVKVSTDDGSRGFKGRVTDLLKNLLSTVDCRLTTIYGCGPRPMLREISRISKKYNVPAQVSLEEHMACGIGACLGCVVKIKNKKSKIKNTFEYKRVCKEGPIFSAQEIVW